MSLFFSPLQTSARPAVRADQRLREEHKKVWIGCALSAGLGSRAGKDPLQRG